MSAETAKVFNAGDEVQVKDRETKAKRQQAARVEGLRYIMGDKRGRAYMRHLLGEKLFVQLNNTVPPDPFTGNSTTFYNLGAVRVGNVVAAELKALCLAEFRMMEDEAKGEA